MQIKSVAILANPRAGTGKATDLSGWLQDQLKQKNISSTIFTNEWPTTTLLDQFTAVSYTHLTLPTKRIV